MPKPTNGPTCRPSHGECSSANGEIAGNTPAQGNASSDVDPPTPPSLTTDTSTCSPESYENVNAAAAISEQFIPSVEDETVFQERYIINPQPARLYSDPTKCLPHPRHDPYMGSGCLVGFGETAKPFPFLYGQPVAEKPPDALLKRAIENWRLGGTVSDTSENGARTRAEPICPPSSGSSERRSEDAPGTNVVWNRPPHVNPHQPAGRSPECAPCGEPPGSAAGGGLGPSMFSFADGSREHAMRVAGILLRVSECETAKNMEMFQLDPETAEPGPQVNFNSLLAIAPTSAQLPKAFQDLLLRFHRVRHRYFVAWDMFLNLAIEMNDLTAERQQLQKLEDEMIANPNRDDGKRQAYIAWRVAQNSEDYRQKVQQYRICQTGLATCANTFLHDKKKTASILADPRTAYRNWMKNWNARAGGAKSSCSSTGSPSVSGLKRARDHDEQQQGNVESARKRLRN